MEQDELIGALVDVKLLSMNLFDLTGVRFCLLEKIHAIKAHRAVCYFAIPWAAFQLRIEARLVAQSVADLLVYDALERLHVLHVFVLRVQRSLEGPFFFFRLVRDRTRWL